MCCVFYNHFLLLFILTLLQNVNIKARIQVYYDDLQYEIRIRSFCLSIILYINIASFLYVIILDIIEYCSNNFLFISGKFLQLNSSSFVMLVSYLQVSFLQQ